jgi:hypothetical protein
MAKKIMLSHAGLAQLAAGRPISQIEHEEVDAAAAVAPAAEAELAVEAPAAEAELAVEAPAAAVETVPEMVAFLKNELAEARLELAGLQASKVQLEGSLADAQANAEGLTQAALHGAGLLQVMLGQSPVSLEGLPAGTITAQYSKYRAAYEARFVVGQSSLEAGEATVKDPTGVEAALKIGLRPVG